MRFRCNTGQRTRPHQVIPRFRASLSRFHPSLSRFQVLASRLADFGRFRCTTVQRTRPRQVIRRLPVSTIWAVSDVCPFPRFGPFPRFRPSLSPFSGVSAVTRCKVRVRVKLSDACPFSPDACPFPIFRQSLTLFQAFPL
jgi:hypothetical protein